MHNMSYRAVALSVLLTPFALVYSLFSERNRLS